MQVLGIEVLGKAIHRRISPAHHPIDEVIEDRLNGTLTLVLDGPRDKEQLPTITRAKAGCEGPFYITYNPEHPTVFPGISCIHELEMLPD